MVQVDVFWSYGIGAGFAYAAKKQLQAFEPSKVEGGWFSNPYFTRNLLYLATIFAPSGLYLLWQHTQWETMQAGDKSMPGWLVTLFAITNVTQGMLGFWLTYKLIKSGRDFVAFLQPFLGYFGMFIILVHGWDGRGYQRFFSEDRAVFLTWTPAHIATWLTSEVALTLGAMGCVLIPVMGIWMIAWAREGMRIAGLPRQAQVSALELVTLVLGAVFVVALGSAIVASLLMHRLGVPIGIAVFTALAAFAVVGPKGAYRFIFNRVDMDIRARVFEEQRVRGLPSSNQQLSSAMHEHVRHE